MQNTVRYRWDKKRGRNQDKTIDKKGWNEKGMMGMKLVEQVI